LIGRDIAAEVVVEEPSAGVGDEGGFRIPVDSFGQPEPGKDYLMNEAETPWP
jgi:hypothetical protein